LKKLLVKSGQSYGEKINKGSLTCERDPDYDQIRNLRVLYSLPLRKRVHGRRFTKMSGAKLATARKKKKREREI
jgi:hypothetical protein